MKKITNAFWILLCIVIVGYLVYRITMRSVTDHLLNNAPQLTKAVIIDERNYKGNEPVHPTFSYSYQFEVDGKKYTGNAHDPSLRVGDTVEVEYVKNHPGMNRPLHPKE